MDLRCTKGSKTLVKNGKCGSVDFSLFVVYFLNYETHNAFQTPINMRCSQAASPKGESNTAI
jgi:hypothetical protein